MGVGAEHGAVMGGNITSIQDFIVQVKLSIFLYQGDISVPQH